MLVVSWARQLKSFVETRDGCYKSPRFRGVLALFRTKLNDHVVGASTYSKVVPAQKPKQSQDLWLLPVAALVGPLKKKVSTLLHHGVRHTQEAIEQEVPDPLVVGHTPPVTWTVNVGVLDR